MSHYYHLRWSWKNSIWFSQNRSEIFNFFLDHIKHFKNDSMRICSFIYVWLCFISYCFIHALICVDLLLSINFEMFFIVTRNAFMICWCVNVVSFTFLGDIFIFLFFFFIGGGKFTWCILNYHTVQVSTMVVIRTSYAWISFFLRRERKNIT